MPEQSRCYPMTKRESMCQGPRRCSFGMENLEKRLEDGTACHKSMILSLSRSSCLGGSPRYLKEMCPSALASCQRKSWCSWIATKWRHLCFRQAHVILETSKHRRAPGSATKQMYSYRSERKRSRQGNDPESWKMKRVSAKTDKESTSPKQVGTTTLTLGKQGYCSLVQPIHSSTIRA